MLMMYRLPVALLALAMISMVSPRLYAEPDYISDRLIQSSIERAGTALIEADKVTGTPVLIEQLQRTSVDIIAPPPVPFTESVDGLYEQAADSVLVIAGLYLCGRCDNYHARCASGFIISEEGLAVTNHHVIDKKDNITLVAMTRDGRVMPVTEVLASNKDDDVALIKLGGDGQFKPLPIAREAHVGQPVHSISHPNGRFYCYSSGEVSRLFMAHANGTQNVRRIQITAAFAKGSSGGPILNDLGQVVGVVTTTDSVYYNDNDGKQENLQMVFYNCVPFESILDLFAGESQ